MSLLPGATLAYTDTNVMGSMIADVSPQYPAPGEVVTVSLKSYAADLNRTNIAWSSDGTIFTQGIGLRKVSVRVGPAGSKTNLRASAQTADGETAIKDLSFMPAGVTLMFQAHTSVPPYYPGRALPTTGSSITILAEPDFVTADGRHLDAANLTYDWVRGESKLESASGYGKYFLDINDLSGLSDETIRVTVTDVSGQLIAESRITIPTQKPRLAIYEEDPLQGTKFSTALSNVYDMLTEEVTLRGEPYFYPQRARNIFITWSLNKEPAITDPENANLITLREAKSQAGSANLVYAAQTSAPFVLSLQLPLSVNFGAMRNTF